MEFFLGPYSCCLVFHIFLLDYVTDNIAYFLGRGKIAASLPQQHSSFSMLGFD